MSYARGQTDTHTYTAIIVPRSFARHGVIIAYQLPAATVLVAAVVIANPLREFITPAVHLVNADSTNPQTNQLTSKFYHPHPPSPFIIIIRRLDG